jgi:hypothetical protein
MISQTLRVAIVAAVIAIATPVVAQDCGCGVSSQYQYGGYGSAGNNCGREITQQQALGLWDNYCSESCGYDGGSSCGRSGCLSGCKLRGKLRSRSGKLGGCGCGGGINRGFNYPVNMGGVGNCGAYTDISSGCGCRAGGKLRGLLANKSCGGQCGNAGGGLLRGERSGCGKRNACGGGCGGKLKALLAKCKLFQGGCGSFGQSRQACGCNGSYFNEAVGYEYGTAGIQSCVGSTLAPVMNFAPAAIGSGVQPTNSFAPVQSEAHGNVVAPAIDHSHIDTIQNNVGGH